jgi:hypothetical protein
VLRLLPLLDHEPVLAAFWFVGSTETREPGRASGVVDSLARFRWYDEGARDEPEFVAREEAELPEARCAKHRVINRDNNGSEVCLRLGS